MDPIITLSADNKENLNKMIDSKLKEGYLIKGGMQDGEQGKIIQIMVRPDNIDSELTLPGAIKLVILLAIYVSILYFIF